MSLTKTQQKAIVALNETFHNVEVHTEHKGMLFATFNNGESHIMLETSYQVRIGKGGRIIFITTSSILSDKKHQRCLASLACFKLNDNGHYSTKVKLV